MNLPNITINGRFRPLAGIKVSKQYTRYPRQLARPLGFRPLAGIKVSELYILCRISNCIQHIVIGISKSDFLIVITLVNYTIKT